MTISRRGDAQRLANLVVIVRARGRIPFTETRADPGTGKIPTEDQPAEASGRG